MLNERRDPIPELLKSVDENRLRADLFFLSKDPLPFRKLNFTRPGKNRCTLYEADDYIVAQLSDSGHHVSSQPISVQALRSNLTRPMPHQFERPHPRDPFFIAYNLIVDQGGSNRANEYVIAIAHKDSQSWTDSPGAYDNAAGTAGLLEMVRVLSNYESKHTLRFVFCNEEHWPWTSEVIAAEMATAPIHVRAVLNIDSIGGKSSTCVGERRKTNTTRYSSPEGKSLAERMNGLNAQYGIGLETFSYFSERPNDDDGSFVKAGIPPAILNIGSFPYADRYYHSAGDIPERVDISNVAKAVQLSLAFVVDADRHEL